MRNFLMLAGRLLLAAMFLWTGFGRLASVASIHNYIDDWSVPGWIKPLLVFWELAGGFMLAAGLFTREVALSLALFCVLSAMLVKLHDDDILQLIDFMKNMALTGGFLYVAVSGAGDWSLEKRFNLKTRFVRSLEAA
jgi:putative oxidoreductase